MRFEFDDPLRHYGMCDASCGIALAGPRFLAADDEANVLGLYDATTSGAATALIDLAGLAGTAGELDVEGSARAGDTIYWITSHGRDSAGRKAPARSRLLGTRLAALETRLEPVGVPYSRLIEDLAADSRYRPFGLVEAAAKPPKEVGGLNIEGLAADASGRLLIGFRSPLIGGRALIATLANPAEVIAEKSPRFGDPLLLELGGRGVRSIEYWPERDALLVVAGPASRKGRFVIRMIPGAEPGSHLPTAEGLVPAPKNLNPEGVLTWPGERDRFLLLSDDGAEERGGRKCKKLPRRDPGRYFRSVWVRCA